MNENVSADLAKNSSSGSAATANAALPFVGHPQLDSNQTFILSGKVDYVRYVPSKYRLLLLCMLYPSNQTYKSIDIVAQTFMWCPDSVTI